MKFDIINKIVSCLSLSNTRIVWPFHSLVVSLLLNLSQRHLFQKELDNHLAALELADDTISAPYDIFNLSLPNKQTLIYKVETKFNVHVFG